MAGGLYNRVAARGMSSQVADGYTGAGALDAQGHTVDPAHGQNVAAYNPSVLNGYDPEPATPPDGYGILEGTWGLAGGSLDNDTPRTHAAPSSGWAGSYTDNADFHAMRENSADIHAQDFGSLRRHTTVTRTEPELDVWAVNDPGVSAQDPVTGQLRAMGGRDAVQGYDRRNGYGFDAGHRERIVATEGQPMAYLDPAERLFIIPDSYAARGSFIPNDAVQGTDPYGSFMDGPAVNYTDPSAYAPPAEPATLTAGQTGGAVSAGWW